MSTEASIAPQKDERRPDDSVSKFFLIDEKARKGFGHMLGMLWLREIEAGKAKVA